MSKKNKEEQLPQPKEDMQGQRGFKQRIRDIGNVLIAAGKGFVEDKVPKLSGSLAYFTIFSIVPLLTIIISIATFVLSNENQVSHTLFAQLDAYIGPQLSDNVQEFVTKASLSGKSNIALVLGIISLIAGATAVFTEIQDTINTIWRVKPVPRKGWLKIIVNRLLSFSIIIGLGFILLVSLVVSGVLNGLQGQFQVLFPGFSSILIAIISTTISFVVITLLFAVIFKVLPDVILPWKPALIGAAFTTLLFGMGKFLIDLYIQKTNPGVIFGAAGSIVLLMLWVYYTAFILYFGAELTQVIAEKYYDGIKPSKYAVHTRIIVEDKNVEELPSQHPEETEE